MGAPLLPATANAVLGSPRPRHVPVTPAGAERSPILNSPRAPRQLPLFAPRRG